jgi:hypothetical protein
MIKFHIYIYIYIYIFIYYIQSNEKYHILVWQECYDQVTGYPYYWHVETNDVQWDMPEELRLIRKQPEMGSGIKSSVQGPHWVDFSSIACNYYFLK